MMMNRLFYLIVSLVLTRDASSFDVSLPRRRFHLSRSRKQFESPKEGKTTPHQTNAVVSSFKSTEMAILDMKLLSTAWNFATKPLKFLVQQFLSLTPQQKVLLLVAFGLGFLMGRVRPFWTRYTDVMEIPNAYFGSYAPVLVGRAAKTTDGDTIRFLHQPTPLHPKALVKGQKLSEYALPIRVCSIDTPETAKFGKSGQPFGEEARIALEELLKGKKVYLKLLQKDQYGRAVAQVFVRSKFLRRPIFVDEHLLKKGLAEVYRGGGAVYGSKGLDFYNSLEATAQSNKLGIWSQKKRESAAEYKKRTNS